MKEGNVSGLCLLTRVVSIVGMGLITLTFLGTPSARAHECPEFAFTHPEEGPLAALNCDFHHRYEERITQTIAKFGAVSGRPVILSLSGQLILKRNGETETVDVNPSSFDQIKALSHAAFAVTLALAQVSPGALGTELAAKLREHQTHLEAALVDLPQLGLPPEAEAPCRALVIQTRDFINDVLLNGSWTQPALAAYHAQVMPLFEQTIDVTTAIELKLLDTVVSRWLATMTDDERTRLGVVVATVHQARAQNRILQYFERKLGRATGVGAQRENGLVCLEGQFDEASAMALLARHYVDREAAQMLFADSSRLQRDLLADAAALHLHRILPHATPIIGQTVGVPDQPDVSIRVAHVGVPFRLTVPVSNTPVRIQKMAGHLPPGVRFDPKTGILSGTPTMPGQYRLILRGVNNVGYAAPTTLIVHVQS